MPEGPPGCLQQTMAAALDQQQLCGYCHCLVSLVSAVYTSMSALLVLGECCGDVVSCVVLHTSVIDFHVELSMLASCTS
jgi:hypothetical protein